MQVSGSVESTVNRFGGIAGLGVVGAARSATGAGFATETIHHNGVGTELDPLDIVVVPHASTVHIECAGAVTDNDDTMLLHTGRYVHDGHDARFALGVSRLLMEADHRSGLIVLSDDERQRGLQTGSVFTPESWGPFESLTGRSEATVIRDMVDAANSRYRLGEKGQTLSAERLSDVVADIMHGNFDTLMHKVQVDDGLFSVFNRFKELGVPMGVCSASGHEIVSRMLKTKGKYDHFEEHAFVCGAVKKNESGFSGDDIRRTCEKIGVDPRHCVMFGDTMNDVGAAKLAGIPVTVIRPAAAVSARDVASAAGLGNFYGEIETAGRDFAKNPRYRSVMLDRNYPQRHVLLIVSDFSQVQVSGKLEGADGCSSFRVV